MYIHLKTTIKANNDLPLNLDKTKLIGIKPLSNEIQEISS